MYCIYRGLNNMNYLAFKVPGINTSIPIEIKGVNGAPSEGTLLSQVLPAVITYLFIATTLLALAFLIYGGIRWITSGGDKTGVENARKTITYAIIGLVIVFLSFFIINTIGNFFGVNLLNSVRATRCSDKNPNGSCPTGKTCAYSKDNEHYRCRLICDRSREICPD